MITTLLILWWFFLVLVQVACRITTSHRRLHWTERSRTTPTTRPCCVCSSARTHQTVSPSISIHFLTSEYSCFNWVILSWSCPVLHICQNSLPPHLHHVLHTLWGVDLSNLVCENVNKILSEVWSEARGWKDRFSNWEWKIIGYCEGTVISSCLQDVVVIVFSFSLGLTRVMISSSTIKHLKVNRETEVLLEST